MSDSVFDPGREQPGRNGSRLPTGSGLPFRRAPLVHAGRWAATLHRLSGLALTLFLPLHFLALGLAFDEGRFGAFIAWTDNPWVKVSEWLLVTALCLHTAGGLRLLAIEMLQTPPLAANWIAMATAGSLGAGLLFLLGAFL